ncbi:glycosyl-phosphatidylinositol-anchored molecule-like protein [Microtus pennsylvanicus]|uniref:glycosyl-phosphatidylinositol-anchored molecule-like protein n=1 Tax=Microtus pennsylvanicus TaxID=10058 RepID=UPI003F6BDA21
MMLTFFLLILLGLPCVDTAVNSSLGLDDSTIGLDNSTSGLNSVIQPRQDMVMMCHHCSVENTFNCPAETVCPNKFRRCGTIAMRMNSRQLLVYKYCMGNCTFMLVQPPPTFRRPTSSNSFYFSYCCSGIFCNDGGPTNLERDLLPPRVVEEDVIARAVRLGQFNLLLSLVLILSSSIPT